jgi:hypothetical protein
MRRAGCSSRIGFHRLSCDPALGIVRLDRTGSNARPSRVYSESRIFGELPCTSESAIKSGSKTEPAALTTAGRPFRRPAREAKKSPRSTGAFEFASGGAAASRSRSSIYRYPAAGGAEWIEAIPSVACRRMTEMGTLLACARPRPCWQSQG